MNLGNVPAAGCRRGALEALPSRPGETPCKPCDSSRPSGRPSNESAGAFHLSSQGVPGRGSTPAFPANTIMGRPAGLRGEGVDKKEVLTHDSTLVDTTPNQPANTAPPESRPHLPRGAQQEDAADDAAAERECQMSAPEVPTPKEPYLDAEKPQVGVAARIKSEIEHLMAKEKQILASLEAVRAEIAAVASLIPRRRKTRAKGKEKK